MPPLQHEVITPHKVRVLWTETKTRSIVQPVPASFRLFSRHFQAFVTPNSLYALVVQSPALVPEHGGDPAVSISLILASQRYDMFGENDFIFSPNTGITLA
jgi:hypothetical protein